MTLILLGLLSGNPASGQMTDVSAPRLLPGDSVLGNAAQNQDEPRICPGGSGYLVVWSDLRTSSSSLLPDQSARDVMGIRLDASGNLLDTTPIELGTAFGEQEQPQVAWNGSDWLVTWENQSPTQFFYASAIQGVRVAPDGSVLDSTPIDILVYGFSITLDYALASDGVGWAVVSQGSSGGESDLLGVRISGAGSVLDPGGKLILTIPQIVLGMRLTFAVDTYLVVYSQLNRIKGLLLDTGLTKKSTQSSNLGPGISSENAPNVGTNGAEFFVIWELAGSTIQGTRVSLQGQVLDPAGLTLTGSGFSTGRDPAVGWDGTQWIALYRNGSFGSTNKGLSATRVTSNGQILDFNGVSLSLAIADQPDVVNDPIGGVRFVWRDSRSQGLFPNDVYTNSLDIALAVGTERSVSIAAPSQLAPDIAAGSGEYMVAFESVRPGSEAIAIQRVDRFGAALDDEPVVLATGVNLGSPRIAWNGSIYFVVWEDLALKLIFGLRVDALGQPLDPFPTAVLTGHEPDVGAEGGQFLVVGWNDPGNVQIRSIYGSRIDPNSGLSLDFTNPLLVGSSFASRPRVESLGGQYLVSWQRNFSHDDSNADVRLAFVALDGTASSSILVASFVYSPDISSNGSSALVVWSDGTGSTINEDLFARRIDAQGNFLDGIPISLSTANANQTFPTGAWDGTEWTTLWSDSRDEVVFFDEREDIIGTKVASDGSLSSLGEFDLWRNEDPTAWASAASLGQGTTLVAAQTFRSDSPLAAYRVELRLVDGWSSTGIGIAGAAGEPVLDGTGDLTVGSQVELALSNAKPLASGVYVYAFSRIDLPLFGGLLVPAIEGLIGFSTDVNGSQSQIESLTSSVALGLQLFVQAWIIDSTGPFGFTATSAVTTVAK